MYILYNRIHTSPAHALQTSRDVTEHASNDDVLLGALARRYVIEQTANDHLTFAATSIYQFITYVVKHIQYYQ